MKNPNAPSVPVVAAIIERDGRVLVAQRPAGSWRAGEWEFPGGKVDGDEDPRDALARECREELAIEIEVGAPVEILRHQYPERSVLLLFFAARILSGEPTPMEGNEPRWVTAAELETLALLPADLPLIPILRRRLSREGG